MDNIFVTQPFTAPHVRFTKKLGFDSLSSMSFWSDLHRYKQNKSQWSNFVEPQGSTGYALGFGSLSSMSFWSDLQRYKQNKSQWSNFVEPQGSTGYACLRCEMVVYRDCPNPFDRYDDWGGDSGLVKVLLVYLLEDSLWHHNNKQQTTIIHVLQVTIALHLFCTGSFES